MRRRIFLGPMMKGKVKVIRLVIVKVISNDIESEGGNYQDNESESNQKLFEDKNLSMEHKIPGSIEGESYQGNESESDQDMIENLSMEHKIPDSRES